LFSFVPLGEISRRCFLNLSGERVTFSGITLEHYKIKKEDVDTILKLAEKAGGKIE